MHSNYRGNENEEEADALHQRLMYKAGTTAGSKEDPAAV